MQQKDNFIHTLGDTLYHLQSIPHDGVILLGDFNDRQMNWEREHNNSELKNELYDLVSSVNMTQVINEPTHYSHSTWNLLDLIITSSPNDITQCGTLPPIGSSHHSVVYCKTQCITCDKCHERIVWDYKHADWNKLNDEIEQRKLQSIVPMYEDIDKCYEHWLSGFLDILRKYIPMRPVNIKTKDKPWITSEVKRLIRHHDRLFNKYKQTRSQRHHDIYRIAKYEARISIDQAKEHHRNRLAEKLADPHYTPKDYWKLNHQLLGNSQHTHIPALLHEGHAVTEPQENAELFNAFFASHSSTPTNDILTDRHSARREICSMNNFQITVNETRCILQKLNTNKANGPDHISNTILKMTAQAIAPSLTALMNRSLTLQQYPED